MLLLTAKDGFIKPINCLSLFDGMSCGRQALKEAGIPVAKYFAAEIDKHAIKVGQKNHPDNIQLGDVTKIRTSGGFLLTNTENPDNVECHKIDLIIGGSPCQGFSFAGKQLAFDDPRSALFFEFVRLVRELKPRYVLLENVKMKAEFLEIITAHLEHAIEQPIYMTFLNSSLLSAQNRQRYYWTNFPVSQPEDRGIMLRDILESGEPVNYSSSGRGDGKVEGRGTVNPSKAQTLTATGYSNRSLTEVAEGTPAPVNNQIFQINPSKEAGGKQPHMQNRVNSIVGKSPALTREFASRLNVGEDMVTYRKLTTGECEALQTLPRGYSECPGVSNSQRYKMLGNGWTVSVITHILNELKKHIKE